jgi:hypothetical protein
MTKFLNDLYVYPEDRAVEPEEYREQFLAHWGFTIYRTHYGADSDQQWSKLLKNITDGVKEGLNELDDDKDYEKELGATIKALNQFRLDSRSDPATLDRSTGKRRPADEYRRTIHGVCSFCPMRNYYRIVISAWSKSQQRITTLLLRCPKTNGLGGSVTLGG